jgi:hypothetical protein
VVHLVIEQRGLHGPGSLEARSADGHLFDGKVLGGGDGCVFDDERFVQQSKFGVAFVGEADGVGEAIRGGQAMMDGAGGAICFALGRDRPM